LKEKGTCPFKKDRIPETSAIKHSLSHLPLMSCLGLSIASQNEKNQIIVHHRIMQHINRAQARLQK
jgi:hypothetical protein